MSNTIKISITLTADTDPEKLGEAIAHLIRAVTPEEEWAEIAQSLKIQASEMLAQRQTDTWDAEEELKPLNLRYTGESDESDPSDEPSRFPFVNQDDPNKPGVGDQF